MNEYESRTGRSFEIECSSAFRERSFGTLQGKLKSDLRKDGRLAHVKLWQPPDGSFEGFEDLARRLLPQMDRATQFPCQALFAHGGVIRLLIGLLEGKSKAEIAIHHIENATPLVVTSPPSGWVSLLPELL